MKRVHLDANVLLRFLRDDDPVQSPQARDLIARGKDDWLQLVLSVLTLAETFYALRNPYKLSRAEAAILLSSLVETTVFKMEEEEIIMDALARTRSANVDFGDAVLAATAASASESVATFDADFRRFKDLKLHRWSRK